MIFVGGGIAHLSLWQAKVYNLVSVEIIHHVHTSHRAYSEWNRPAPMDCSDSLLWVCTLCFPETAGSEQRAVVILSPCTAGGSPGARSTA